MVTRAHSRTAWPVPFLLSHSQFTEFSLTAGLCDGHQERGEGLELDDSSSGPALRLLVGAGQEG